MKHQHKHTFGFPAEQIRFLVSFWRVYIEHFFAKVPTSYQKRGDLYAPYASLGIYLFCWVVGRQTTPII